MKRVTMYYCVVVLRKMDNCCK